MMTIESVGIETLIQTFGFPVALVIVLGLVVVKLYDRTQTNTEKREEKLIIALEDVNKNNTRLLEVSTELTDVNKQLVETNKKLTEELSVKISNIDILLKESNNTMKEIAQSLEKKA